MHRDSRNTLADPLTSAVPPAKPGSTSPTAPSRFARVSVGMSDTGAAREQNEDAYFCDDGAGLYLVCDGMGGHASGQLASEMAIRSVVEYMFSHDPADPDREPLAAALQLANRAILTRASLDPSSRGMGTTAVGIRAEDDIVHICHVGDSRCYLLRGGQLQQVTEDHSLANLYKKNPELAARMGPAQSNVIVRAIGLEPSVEVDHRIMSMEDGDLFMLCCDGVTDMVEDWMLQEILTSDETLAAMAENVIRAANANGGHDNITVILLRVMASAEAIPQLRTDGGKTLPGY